MTVPAAATLCVYAIVDGRSTVPARGAGGARLVTVAGGRFAAIAARVPRAPRPSPRNLRQHDGVVRDLWSRLPAVLPARFGTSFGGAADLALALIARERTLARDVRRVRGRAQMTVRVMNRTGTGAAAVPLPALEPSAASGTEYLRRRAALAAREREIPGFASLRAAVGRWVREERVETHAGVASVYHLVPRGSVEAYRRAMERAAAGSGLGIVVTGPHPPYAFC